MSESLHVQSPLTNAYGRSAPKLSLGWVLLAIVLGAVFVFAGAAKVLDPPAFAKDISHYQILSFPLGMALAFYLPWLEIFSGLALIFGRLRSGALGILIALTVIFIGATLIARVRGIDPGCGCFGSATKGLGFGWHLVLDFALLLGLFMLGFSPFATGPRGRR